MPFSVIVPWRTDNGPRQRLWDWNKKRWNALFDCEVIEADSGDKLFSRSKSRNQGVERATHDEFVIADADTVPMATIDECVTEARAYGAWFIAYAEKRYYNLSEEATERVLELPVYAPLTEPVEGEYEHKLTSWAGMLVMNREAFNQAGGYDERFVGWGWEDNAFQQTMDSKWRHHQRIDDFVVHLWHPRDEADFGTEHELRNRRLFQREYQR